MCQMVEPKSTREMVMETFITHGPQGRSQHAARGPQAGGPGHVRAGRG